MGAGWGGGQWERGGGGRQKKKERKTKRKALASGKKALLNWDWDNGLLLVHKKHKWAVFSLSSLACNSTLAHWLRGINCGFAVMTQMKKCLFDLMANIAQFQLLFSPTHGNRVPNQMLFYLKSHFFSEKETSPNIINIGLAGRGKHYLHENSFKRRKVA